MNWVIWDCGLLSPPPFGVIAEGGGWRCVAVGVGGYECILA